MAENFENFLISPDFPILGKVTKFQRIISNALRVMDKNLWGVPKDPPGLNRVKLYQAYVGSPKSISIPVVEIPVTNSETSSSYFDED